MNKTETKVYVEGTVVSMPSPKTVIVSVVHEHRHPLYKKAVKRMQRFAVHNEGITLAIGDKVKIRETRPISRTKHFIIVSKIG